MIYIYGFGIKITEENRSELKEFYNKFENKNKGFTFGYYMGYSIYEQRFKFGKNPNTIKQIVDTLDEFKIMFHKHNVSG